MMYLLKNLQTNFAQPARKTAETIKNIISVLPDKYSRTPFFSSTSGLLDIFSRITRQTKKPSFNIAKTVISSKEYSVCEEIITSKPFGNLLHFKVQGMKKRRPKLMIIAPISGHFATLLRDTVKRMVAEHDVYITDWISASMVPLKFGVFGLDEYNSYIIDFLHKIGPGAHVMAVCQPVVQGLAVCAIMSAAGDPCTPSSIILMGGPIDPRKNPTMVNKFAESFSIKWFENNLIQTVPSGFPGVGRRVYPGFVQIMAFISMNPHKHFDAHTQYLIDCIESNQAGQQKHRDFYDEYLTTMDMDREFFIETVDKVFKRYDFAKGIMKYKGKLIDPKKITKTALLTVEGERDDISALGQTTAAHDLCPNVPKDHKKSFVQPGVGHYGVFSGSKWRSTIAPVVTEFIYKHDS
ncbi:MAG: polyhydroxyalkanoate depolymerase [Holosporales bacterium]|jgi:poly(3-hydroxybutyrate) depolymerase|nr:polyhydroxyalkanoate depolymerase [Holosporales bacterium]